MALIFLFSRTASAKPITRIPSTATSSTFVESCDFEELNICGMIQGPNNKWEQRMAVSAGPQTDFTSLGQCKGSDNLYTYICWSFKSLFWFYVQIHTAFNIGIKYFLFNYFYIVWLLTILECTIYFVLYLLVIQPPGSIKYSRSRSQLITLSGHKGIGS